MKAKKSDNNKDLVEVTTGKIKSRAEAKAEVIDLLIRDERTSPVAVVNKLGEMMVARKAMLEGGSLVDVIDHGTRTEAVKTIMKAYGVGGEGMDIDIDARRVVLNIGAEERAKLKDIAEVLRGMNRALEMGEEQSGEIEVLSSRK